MMVVNDGTHGLNYQRHDIVDPVLVHFFSRADRESAATP